jgi:hypothetical protein
MNRGIRAGNLRNICFYSPQTLLGQRPTAPLRLEPSFARRGAFWPNVVARSVQLAAVQRLVQLGPEKRTVNYTGRIGTGVHANLSLLPSVIEGSDLLLNVIQLLQ